MMQEEFEELTGIYPTMDMYKAIEELYMQSELEKADFCKAFKENRDGIAVNARAMAEGWEYDKSCFQKNQEAEYKSIIQAQGKTIGDLKQQLEVLNGWRPYEVSKMTKSQYDELKKAVKGKELAEEEAKRIINSLFGFDPSRIQLLDYVPAAKINFSHTIRLTEARILRPALYDATDHNYIRFDVGCQEWELVNGELYKFFD